MDRHVVRNKIENEAHASAGQSCVEPGESGFPAQLRTKRCVIDHVVAVVAACAGLKEWRCVDVTDAEGGEIGNQLSAIVESELVCQLQPVGRERQRWRHHAAPMLQKTE